MNATFNTNQNKPCCFQPELMFMDNIALKKEAKESRHNSRRPSSPVNGAGLHEAGFVEVSPASAVCSAKAPIFIVDDFALSYLGMRSVIDSQTDMAVGGRSSHSEAISAIGDVKSDAVVVTLMKAENLETVKRITRQWPLLPVLVCSMLDDAILSERVLRAGAKGYFSIRRPLDEFSQSIRKILQGHYALTDDLTERIYSRVLGNRPQENIIDKLSDRELEVFYNIGMWRGTAEIAERLELRVKTIESHRAHIMEKLGVKGASNLVRSAVEWVTTLCGSPSWDGNCKC